MTRSGAGSGGSFGPGQTAVYDRRGAPGKIVERGHSDDGLRPATVCQLELVEPGGAARIGGAAGDYGDGQNKGYEEQERLVLKPDRRP